jgi:hypothetical protein
MSLINLTTEQKRFYLDKIETTFSEKKLFLRGDFSLPDLVEETGIQLYILSYIINSEIKLNFKDYVNLMRVLYRKNK